MSRKKIFFVSDTHVDKESVPRMELVCRFLDMVGREGAELYVAGDLFDFWLERPRAMRLRCADVLDRLKDLSASGVKVCLIHGNRDFAMNGYFERELGCRILGSESEITLGGKRIFLSHGDTFCTRDRWYLRWRRVIRSWPVRAGFALLPTPFILWCIRKFKAMSRREIKRKTSNEMAIVPEEVEKIFAKGFDMVISGHIHQSQRREYAVGGRKCEHIVLGGWDEGSPYLVFDGEKFEHKQFSKTNEHVEEKKSC